MNTERRATVQAAVSRGRRSRVAFLMFWAAAAMTAATWPDSAAGQAPMPGQPPAGAKLNSQLPATAPLLDLQNGFARLAEHVGPAVVTISVRKRVALSEAETQLLNRLPDEDYQRLFGRPKPKAGQPPGAGEALPDKLATSAGSGVLIAGDGMVLTNQHVIEDAAEIEIALPNRRRYPARVVGTDARSDLAVLKIEATGLATAQLGDADQLRVGHWTAAMGNPFGIAQDGRASLSIGVVSALGRYLGGRLGGDDDRYYGNLIQTDASINPGNSGGPLLNIHGEVVGINTVISTRSGGSEGVGFAIPINAMTQRIIKTLAAGKTVEYGFLGVRIANPGDEQCQAVGLEMGYGALIAEIEKGGPAALAGLRGGDIVAHYGGARILDSDHLVRLVGSTPVGETVSLEYRRANDKTPRNALVKITRRPQLSGGETLPPKGLPKKDK